MSTYTVPLTDDIDIVVTTETASQGSFASAHLVGDPGGIQTFGGIREELYMGYCLTEVVALTALKAAANFPMWSDPWNVWEAIGTLDLPECECE